MFLFEDKEWAQYILGALAVLQYAYNWYEAGDVSTEEAAEAFRLIVQDAPYNLRTCPNPAGGKIFRLASNGRVEEYGDAGDWQDPSGDATIPPVPEREGGTPDDQKCLAAKNAAHVLELLYENITDSFNEGLDEAETATALTLGLVSLIGAEFAPITFALVTFFGIVFSVLYGTLEFVGADLWDENFTQALYCMLLGCATNDAGVVTFDWDCFQAALAAQTTIVPLEFTQLRLFAQIEYLLLVIGGVDALNAAGATTAITDDDCSACDATWCKHFDDTSGFDTWDSNSWPPSCVGSATWDGTLWNSADCPPRVSYIWLSKDCDSCTITDAALHTSLGLTGSIWINGDGSLFSGTKIYEGGYLPGTYSGVVRLDIVLATVDVGMPDFTMDWSQFSGTGDSPFGENNC